MTDVESSLSLYRNHLIALALLIGCDYCPKGVPGVGKTQAVKLCLDTPADVILQKYVCTYIHILHMLYLKIIGSAVHLSIHTPIAVLYIWHVSAVHLYIHTVVVVLYICVFTIHLYIHRVVVVFIHMCVYSAFIHSHSGCCVYTYVCRQYIYTFTQWLLYYTYVCLQYIYTFTRCV